MPRLREKTAARFRLLVSVYHKFGEDHGFLLAAGIAFSLLMCMIPILLLILASAGAFLVGHQELLGHILRYLGTLAPALDPKITKNLSRIIQDRQIVGILGVAGTAWTATWVFSNLRFALNMIFRVKKGRGLLRGKLVDLAMILLCASLLLASIGITALVAFVGAYLPRFPLDLGPVFQFTLTYLIPFLFTLTMFLLIYLIAPNKRVPLAAALKASIFTSLLWEVAKLLFSWYVLHLGRFSVIYGSLGTLAIFFLWLYYSSVVFILGGEIAFVLGKEEESGS